ncbi:MAG: hypothetical protein ACREUN_09510 [Burkholderiales bacterium]
MTRVAALAALLCALPAPAHDLITVEGAEVRLRDAAKWRAVVTSPAPPGQRAEAHYRIGVMLEELRGLLNADVATHGKVQGLPSSYLIAELERLGVPLAYAGPKRRFLSNRGHFEEALRLAPKAGFAADAALRLLQGAFYDSFEHDPLDWNLDRRALLAEIALAEGLLARFPAHAGREEIEFIAAILYTRAARSPGDRELAARYTTKAREATASFAARYPDSLRAAAMPVLQEALPR